MEPSRQALRRNPSDAQQLSNTADLPCYDGEELTDFQVSVPMPARSQFRVAGDRETTEELNASTAVPPAEVTGPLRDARRKRLERTQPIALTCLTPTAQPQEEARRKPSPEPGRTADGMDEEKEPSASVRKEPAPGDVLAGRYVVAEQVDHYGMGLVYRALDRHRERAGSPMPWVALKFARPSLDAAPETSAFLRQEFLKLSLLNHPNIVTVFDITCDDGLDFIVMEWLSGETLSSLLARITAKRIALEKAADIVRCTARALAHAHELGIVHGDVKPSNIFLTNNRTVKVLDFGSSGTTTSDRAPDGEFERNWATRAYASREVLRGQVPQPHDDVFALGVTAYCLLSGERPFGELDALAAGDQDIVPRPLPPDALERWPAVRHALQFDGIERPRSAKLFLQEFDEAVSEATVERTSSHSPTVAYGALVATLLASVVWWSVQSVGDLPPDAQSALAKGNEALAEGRLVEPEGASAWSFYSAVLDAEPGNRYALDGLEEIAERYLSRARQALSENDAAGALASMEVASQVSPDHFGIAVLEDLIARQGGDFLVRARHVAETDMGRAEALLIEAESLLPADDPRLAQVREQLSRQRVINRVDALLEEIDDRILSERLTVPSGDSAVDLHNQAKALAPDDRKVTLAADRIMTALLFQAMFAISNGDLDAAENFLATARTMGVRHLALARAEYELAKARREALSARTGRN